MRPDYHTLTSNPDFSSDFMCIREHCVAITDGVSQWKDFGINPRFFSQKLAENFSRVINEYLDKGQKLEKNKVKELLQ